MPRSTKRSKQTTLQVHPTGQVALKGVEPRAITEPSSASSPRSRRELLRESFARPQRDLDGPRSDAEGFSSDEGDIALEEAPARLDANGEDAEMDDGQGGASSSSSGEEVEVRVAPSAGKGKGKGVPRVVLSDDDDEDDEAPSQASPSTNRPTAVKSAHPADRRSRSVSIFDGVVIPIRPRRRLSPSKQANPGPSKARASPLREEEEEAAAAASSDESDEPVRSSQRARTSKGKKRAAPSSASSSAASDAGAAHSGDDDDDYLPVHDSIAADNARRASKRERQGQDAALRSSAKKGGKAKSDSKKRRLVALTQGRRDRRSADDDSEGDFVVDDDVVQFDTSTEEEEGTRRQEAKAPVSAKRANDADRKGKGKERAREESNAEEEEEEEDEGARAQRSSQRGKRKRSEGKSREEVQRELLATDSEDEDDGIASSRRRKKGSQRKKVRHRSSDDEDDDDDDDEPDDLEILDKQTVREEKFRQRQDKSSRFAQLKAAREQRAAKNKPIILDSEDETPPPRKKPKKGSQQARYMGEDDDDDKDDSQSGSDSGSDVGEATYSSPSVVAEDLSEDLDDFIVDGEPGEDDQLVQNWRESIRGQSQGLRFYIKQYLSYLVFVSVDPECDWLADDKEWTDAHQRVHNHLTGLLNSLISSSAWKPKFKHAVDTRPEMVLDALEADERGIACDACTMGKSRHSTFRATVSGPKYDPKTLRPIDAEDDSSSSKTAASDEEEEEDEREGRPAKEKTYEFALGASCAARAEVYSQLKHWAFETRLRLVDKLSPLRRELGPVLHHAARDDVDAGTSRREERRRERARRAMEAGRLVEELERRQVMGDFATRLVDEIESAQKAFAK